MLFGIPCAPEIFQRVVSDILAGLPGITVYIDDISIFGKNQVEHDARLVSVLERLRAANLKLNWDKCNIGKDQVKYLGHMQLLTKDGVQANSSKLSAISEMAPPKTVADAQRFLGMVTYLGKFVPCLTGATDPLRRLMKREPFTVDESLLSAFAAAKEAVVSSLQTLAYFQPSMDVATAISCDASPTGLGAILWQQSESGQWLPITCASRTLTDVESLYSQMEREMLGVVFALTRFRQYVLGLHVQVHTDRKPLIPIVQKPFDEVPPRLQRWLVALMPHDYTLKHVPGKELFCTDALSRAPVPTTDASPAESRSLHEYVGLVLEAAPVSLDDIRCAARDDPVASKVTQRVLTNSWHDLSSCEQQYYLIRDQLTVVNGILMMGGRFVIPEGVRSAIMTLAHEGHPRQEAFLDTLRQRVWWPGMTGDAGIFVERCSECWRRRANSPQEILPTEIVGVWNKLAIDIVTIDGYSILSVIDYGSRYPLLKILRSTTSAAVIEELEDIFATFGIPDTLVSDNGPQFVSGEMETFLSRLCISHVRSSPWYARSNGMVERLHRVVRERLAALKAHLPFRRRLNQVLFDIRSSRDRMLGTSPSAALFSRQLRTRIPARIDPMIVNPQHQLKAKAGMANDHDSQRGVHMLPNLRPGTKVVVQDGYCDTARPWTVVSQHGRQVGVTDGSRYLLRNRQHVREYVSPHKPVECPPMPLSPESRQDTSSAQRSVLTPPHPVDSPPASHQSCVTQNPELQDTSERSATKQTTAECEPVASSSGDRRFIDGAVTRSGRQIKLTEKARLYSDSLR